MKLFRVSDGTVVATLGLGIYPRLLFDAAEASARTLGGGGVAAVIR